MKYEFNASKEQKNLVWEFELHFSGPGYGAVVVSGDSFAYIIVMMYVICRCTGDYCEHVFTRWVGVILICFLSID